MKQRSTRRATSSATRQPTSNPASTLADQIDAHLPAGFAQRKAMFGGITFMHRGNMLCCTSRKGLMVRVGAENEPTALMSPYASRCLGAGRPMAGFVLIEPNGLIRDADVVSWLAMARRYVESLPEKTSKRERTSSKHGVHQSRKSNP